jgi:hypothetical protein
MSQTENDDDLLEDIESRIEILENTDDAEFGSFTSIDYLVLITAALLLPALALILAA